MCGLFGFSGRREADVTKLRMLAFLNETRGYHSTGVFTVGGGPKRPTSLVKEAKKATDFIQSHEFVAAVKGATEVIGHTRHATVGAVNKQNAHPFDKDHGTRVVGAHNGFVIEHTTGEFIGPDKLFKPLIDDFPSPFEVDSEIIFAVLSAHGGDYEILPKLQGAITVAYMVPDKWDGVVFLYAREARSLHFGRAPEGIYWSSEELPLKMIGCTEVFRVANNWIHVFKHGDILDIKKLEEPAIKSIKFDAKRHNWEYGIADEELQAFPELMKEKRRYKPVTHSHNGYGHDGYDYGASEVMTNRPAQAPKNDNKILSKKKISNYATQADEIMESLIGDIETDLKNMGITKLPDSPADLYAYEGGDYGACVIALKLRDSVKKLPLSAFLIYDKNDTKTKNLRAMTALNGVTAIKYPLKLCATGPRTLVIADAIDGKSVWEYTFTPKSGSIMEVVLELPFPQTKEGTSPPNNEGSKGNDVRQELAGLEGTHGPVLPSNLAILRDTDPNSREVSEHISTKPEEQVRGGHSGRTSSSETESKSADGGAIYGFDGQAQRDRRTITFPISVPWDECLPVLKKSTSFFSVEENTFRDTVEFKRIAELYTRYLGSVMLLSKLFYDAIKIKSYAWERHKKAYSFGHFCLLMLIHDRNRYILLQRPLVTEERKYIDDFIEQMRSNSLTLKPKVIGVEAPTNSSIGESYYIEDSKKNSVGKSHRQTVRPEQEILRLALAGSQHLLSDAELNALPPVLRDPSKIIKLDKPPRESFIL